MNFDNLIVMIIFLVGVFVGGIFGGLIYTSFNMLEVELQTVDFQIPFAQNSTIDEAPNVTTFQEVLDITIYPFFDVADSLPYLTYFMCFAFIIALAMVAYLSTKNSLFFVVHLLFTLLLTYFAILLSNAYTKLLTDSTFNNMMVEFPVYNLLMIYLPQVFFVTSLVFASISFVNVVKPSTKDNPFGVNYGGDF